MPNQSQKSKTIAKNTAALYFRSLFNLFVALYSSRLIVDALGTGEYGLYNVVTGFVSMFWLVSGSITSAVRRFLNIELGRGDTERLNRVFSMSLVLLMIMSGIVLILAQTFGVWYIEHTMNIPEGREKAALWVFLFSVITLMSSFTVIPFNAAIIAHEKMGIYAYLGIIETLLRLGIALLLTYGRIKMDLLVLYAILCASVTLTIQVIAIIYCTRHFSECRIRPVFERKLFKELFSFAGWNFVGSIAGTFSGQGVNQILNIFHGTVVNASRGLAGTVNRSVGIFVNNFTLALEPQITQSYAAGDREYMKSLTYKGTRLSFFIMFIFALPLILETEFVMDLWQVTVPPHLTNFVRLILIISLIDLTTDVFKMAQRATGIIRAQQLAYSIISLCIFPASYLALKKGMAPEVVYFISIIASTLRGIVTLTLVNKHLGYSFTDIFKKIYIKLIQVVVASASIPLGIFFMLPYGWLRFLIILPVCIILTVLSILFLGCDAKERNIILGKARQTLSELFRKNQA